MDSAFKQYLSDTGESLIKKGADALGFGDARQVAISQEAVELTNQMVDAGLISDRYRVNLVLPEEGEMNRQNTGISGDEEIFNIVNHALFAYYAGQNPLSGFGAQAKEHFQGMQQKMRGKDPRTEYLDYARDLDSLSEDIYRYLNFHEIESFQKAAETMRIPSVNIVSG